MYGQAVERVTFELLHRQTLTRDVTCKPNIEHTVNMCAKMRCYRVHYQDFGQSVSDM